jgi:hypothetical protein
MLIEMVEYIELAGIIEQCKDEKANTIELSLDEL